MRDIIERDHWPKDTWPSTPYLAYILGKGWCVCGPIHENRRSKSDSIMGYIRASGAQVMTHDVLAIADLPPLPRLLA